MDPSLLTAAPEGKPSARADAQFVSNMGQLIHVLQSAAERYHMFQRIGEIWHLSYTVDGHTERGDYQDAKGLAYYHYLLTHPNRDVSPIELQRAIAPPPPNTVRSLRKLASKDADGDDPLGARSGFSEQEVVDEEEFSAARKEIEETRACIEDARRKGDATMVEMYEKDLHKLVDQLKRDTRPGGKSRSFGRKPEQKAQAAIQIALRRSRERIAPQMPRLAEHLERSVRWENGAFRYRPSGAPVRWA